MSNKNETGASTGVFVSLSILAVVVLIAAIYGISVALAPVFGKGDAYKQTEGANYRIENYEYFKSQCNAVVGQDAKIALAKAQVREDKANGADKATVLRDGQNVQALQNIRIELVQDYNAKASQTTTTAKFKEASLPTTISVDPSTEGTVTCPE